MQIEFRGSCDGSAGFAPGNGMLLIADDELYEERHNVLSLYALTGGAPLQTPFNLNPHLGITEAEKEKEADVEAAAAVGKRVYWITSHARSKKGKVRPARHQFFATEWKQSGTAFEIHPVGTACHTLKDDLIQSPALSGSLRKVLKDAEEKGPEEKGGWSIEGLGAMPDGTLLIGFRNPVPEGRALLMPLRNPAAVIEQGQKAEFGRPVHLDLSEGGTYPDRGIRDIQYWEARRFFVLIAGSYLPITDENGRPTPASPFALFRWSGNPAEPPERLNGELHDLLPEAIVLLPGERQRFLILSDDGSRNNCKEKPRAAQTFRALWWDM